MVNNKATKRLLRLKRASSNDERHNYISVDERLTPDFLLDSLAPFINTLSNLQNIVDELKGERPTRIHVSTLFDDGISDLAFEQSFKVGDEDTSGISLAMGESNKQPRLYVSKEITLEEEYKPYKINPESLELALAYFYLSTESEKRYLSSALSELRKATEILPTKRSIKKMITLGMDGVKDAFGIFREILLPEYRKQAEKKAKLDNLMLQAQIQHLNAQVLTEKAKAEHEKATSEVDQAQAELLIAQSKKTQAESYLLNAQAEKILAEVEKEKQLIITERIQLATQIINQYAPNLSEPEKINYIMRLLPTINNLIDSKVTRHIIDR